VNLLRLSDAEVAYGDRQLLRQASLVLQSGEKVALVGRNGAGKSTLLKVLAGEVQLDDGSLWRADNLKVSVLAQTVTAAEDDSVYHVVVEGLGELGELLDRYHQTTLQQAERQLESLADIEAGIEALGGWNVEQRVNRVLERMALPADVSMRECSGGMRRRAMLARALVAEPDLLLLDEPTNHLDIPAIDALQQMLTSTRATVVFVSHDRALIDAVATRIVEVDRGELQSYPGTYAAYQERKRKADAEEASNERKFDQHLAREETWIRQGIKARRTRNEGRVRRLQALRAQRAARLDKQGNVRLDIDGGQQSGALVAELENVCFGYDTVLIKDFSTRIMRGDRVGIIGPNGSGKSTLLRLLLGELEPDSGTVTRGTRLQTAYFDQQRAQLDDRLSVRESVGEGSDTITVGGRDRHVVGYLGDFLFPAAQLNQPVGSLSGGEKNRLLMAKLFAQPANLMVLDEPTNDLDVETLELLEELFSEFPGTLLVVSHDRAFLDAVVTSTIVFEADGGLREYVGGYSDWQMQTKAQDKAASPRSRKPRERGKKSSHKLGFKEQRELAALPDQIEALEATQAELQARVGSTEFYQQPADEIQAGLAELSEVSVAVEQAYERWQALSERDGAADD
jgi:ATP-binding cassette subfamily F protein uup